MNERERHIGNILLYTHTHTHIEDISNNVDERYHASVYIYIKETRYYFAHTSTRVCFNEMVFMKWEHLVAFKLVERQCHVPDIYL